MRVVIIGAGWVGLYALKWLLEEQGVDEVVCYEKGADVGGNWVYGESRLGGVARTTHTTSSRSYMHACDYPMPREWPDFPHHEQILSYIKEYARHFGLTKHIRTEHTVTSVRKEDGRWVVRVQDASGLEAVEVFDRVVVATGLPTNPSRPPVDSEPWCDYTGPVTHSASYKAPPESLAGKNVLLVGAGETASDIAVELAKVCDKVYMSSREGVWIHDRDMAGACPVDVVGNRAVWSPGYFNSSLVTCAGFILEIMWGPGGTGVSDWVPRRKPYMRSFLNKSRDVMREVTRGRVIPRRSAVRIDGKRVWFSGREHEDPAHIDHVLWCSGYMPEQAFLERPISFDDLFHYVFVPEDPTMAFVGTARPVFGSFPGLGEIQARWVAAVFGGRALLPPSAEMAATVKDVADEHARVFPGDEDRSTLVNHFEYSDRVAAMFGARPHLLREYLANPLTWFRIVYQVWTPFQFLLNDPNRREEALKNLYDEYPPRNAFFDFSFHAILVHLAMAHIFALSLLLFFFYFFLRLLV